MFAAILALSLFGFNIAKRRFDHGLYQFFASALGFSLIFYPIGYYTVVTGTFGDAISHTLYPVVTLGFLSNTKLIDNATFYGLLALALGLLTLIVSGIVQSKPAKQYAVSIMARLGLASKSYSVNSFERAFTWIAFGSDFALPDIVIANQY